MNDMRISAIRGRSMRWWASWLAGFVLLALFVSGCQQDNSKTVQVLGTAPSSTTQPGPEETPDDSAPTPTANPDTGGSTGDSEQPTGPGGENPEPGTGPGDDETSGPTGDTGAGDDSPGVAPGEGDRPGGLRLLAPPPPYEWSGQ